jgi:hypothetical protein
LLTYDASHADDGHTRPRCRRQAEGGDPQTGDLLQGGAQLKRAPRIERGEAEPQPYRLPPPQRLEAKPGVNLDKALQLAGELEDAETMRKLRVGK